MMRNDERTTESSNSLLCARLQRAGVLICAMALGACGSTDSEAEPGTIERPLCDGSDAFTFQHVWQGGNWDDSAFSILLRNGHAFLRVDGHCRFYSYDIGRTEPILTGTLTEGDAELLAQSTSYGKWPAVNGLVARGTSLTEGVGQVLSDGTNELACQSDCQNSPAPEDLEASRVLDPMLDAANDWHARLSKLGTPISGDVRFAVVIQRFVDAEPLLEWPLATPIETYAVDRRISAENPNWESIRTGFAAEGADAEALRALRARAAEVAVPGRLDGWILIDGPGDDVYEVVVSDVLPYEDETGVVPLRSVR